MCHLYRTRCALNMARNLRYVAPIYPLLQSRAFFQPGMWRNKSGRLSASRYDTKMGTWTQAMAELRMGWHGDCCRPAFRLRTFCSPSRPLPEPWSSKSDSSTTYIRPSVLRAEDQKKQLLGYTSRAGHSVGIVTLFISGGGGELLTGSSFLTPVVV